MSLLARLFALLAVALAPVLGALAYDTYDNYRDNGAEARASARRQAARVGTEGERLLDGARQLLIGLAETPIVRRGDAAACTNLFEHVRHRFPQYAIIDAADLNGDTYCAGDNRSNVRDRPHFRRAVETGDFAVGEYAVGRTSGRKSLHVAYPIRGDDERVSGVVVAAIDLDWLADYLAKSPWPQDTTVILADRNGTVLVHLPERDGVGQPLPAAYRDFLHAPALGVADDIGEDGVQKVIAYEPLDIILPWDVFVAVGTNADAAFAATRADMRRSIALAAAAIALALAGAWLVARRGVLQPVAVLLRAVTARRDGDLTVRTRLRGGSEIARLGCAFDTMADAVAERNERARRAAEEADAARQQTKEILESVQDGFYALDRDWRFTYVNAAAEGLWGKKREELLGRVVWEVLPEAGGSECHRQHLLAADAGQPHRYEAKSAVTGQWVAVTIYPSPTGLSVYFRDVTERKAAEEALERSEATLRGFCESSPLPMGIAESAGDDIHRVYDNPAAQRLLGLPDGDAVGRPAATPSAPIRAWVARYREAEMRGAPLRFEHAREGAPGETPRLLSVTVSVIRPAGRPRFCYVAEDITERRLLEIARREELEALVAERTAALEAEMQERQKAEAALHHSQKIEAMGRLTGGIAHDFNNLLTVVLGNLELITSRAGGDERLRRLAQAAQHAAERGSRLTAQLLAFSRRQTLRPETVEIDAVLRDIADLLRRATGETVRLEIAAAEDLWPTRVDAAQVESAVLNLAINAKDAMPQGGDIRIEADNIVVDSREAARLEIAAGEYVRVAVRDTGHGMPPDVAASAFEPFFTTKEVGKGTGLGLSQVYGFARQSGGTAAIESVPGQGTAVILYLPRAMAAVEPAPAPAASPPAEPPATGALSILIVEDEPDVLDLMSTVLAERGYRILTARDGVEATRILSGDQPLDLLLSDIAMPNGLSGIELAKDARRLRPDLRVLLTTGYARDDLARHAGPDAFEVIRKPYHPGDLARRVAGILRDRSMAEARQA